MTKGDLVRVYNKIGFIGLGYLVKRTYLAYEVGRCRWNVMVKGKVIEVQQRRLRVI